VSENALFHGYSRAHLEPFDDSERMSTACACGVDIVSATSDPDDVRVAVASHNETPRHTEWRAVQALKEPTRRGPCICKGGAAA
jgi:hypothetical protein